MKMLLLIFSCVTLVVLLATATALAFQPLNIPQTEPTNPVAPTPTSLLSSPTIVSPSPSPSPLLTPTAMPKPSTSATPPPLTGSFGPLGGFRIVSPTNTLYNSSELTLKISGQAIAAGLSMSYSIDGKERVAIAAHVRQAHDWDPFFGVINETVTLPPLESGHHSLTVYGQLLVKDCPEVQTTVNFTIA